MCLYNHETQTLRLFDVSQNNDSQVMLETPLLCAIVECNDDQIFYVRRSKTPHRLGLYSRSIQGITFGNEVLHSADLSSFSPEGRFCNRIPRRKFCTSLRHPLNIRTISILSGRFRRASRLSVSRVRWRNLSGCPTRLLSNLQARVMSGKHLRHLRLLHDLQSWKKSVDSPEVRMPKGTGLTSSYFSPD